jgi:hypothetical protein
MSGGKRYWQENPNHKAEWGESGGLPIESLTLEGHASRIQSILRVGLLTTAKKQAITDVNGNFILIGEINIIYGGVGGKAPIYARERQLERLLPGADRAYSTLDADWDGIPDITAPTGYVAFDGTNWFASMDPNDLLGMTMGYLSLDGFGNVIATTGSSPTALTVSIVGGNVYAG